MAPQVPWHHFLSFGKECISPSCRLHSVKAQLTQYGRDKDHCPKTIQNKEGWILGPWVYFYQMLS